MRNVLGKRAEVHPPVDRARLISYRMGRRTSGGFAAYANPI
jgi:hypothetical protein